MYKRRKRFINMITLIYIILTIIEFIKYILNKSSIYGLIYLLMTFFILFLLVPVCFNYKKYYSSARISKLFIIVVLGFITSYILNIIVLKSINYIDSSNTYIKSIFITKNILKPIIYTMMLLFTKNEFKLEKLISNKSNKIKE